VRRLALAGLLAAVVAVPASAQEEPRGTTLAAFRGTVLGVAQDARSIAWLQWSPDGCFLRIRPRAAKTIKSVKYAATCNPFFHDLLLDGGRAVWTGDDEVICGKTYATVYAYAGTRPRLVQKLPRDCLGFGPSLRGVVSDGQAFYYNVFKTARPPAAAQCGNLGGLCQWELAGGQIFRVEGTRRVPLRGLPPTVMFAVNSGRVILVQPLKEFAGGSSAGWPRPVRNGRVQVREISNGRLVSSFRPEGLVRSVALTPTSALVLVEYNGLRTVESYDVRTGRHLRTVKAPVSLRRLPPSGTLVAFPLNYQVSVFDVSTGKRWVVARTRFNTVGLSIRDGWVAWGENHNKFARIVFARGL
jgi:WD40 repeat protein